MKNKITRILKTTFAVNDLEVRDDSTKHTGHSWARPGGETHFSITIISKDFEGKKLLERHQMIYDALRSELKTSVHSLAIKAATPAETNTKSASSKSKTAKIAKN